VKEKILSLLIEKITAEIATLSKILGEALSAATHEESRPENQYDTRSVEASYLAAGQGQRIEGLRRALSILRQTKPRSFSSDEGIQLGALVVLNQEKGSSQYFISPVAGGYQIECEGRVVNIITPESKLGQELLDKHEGDEVEVFPGPRVLTIASVA
jgi:transcription elongation GreA/GreB family factor